MNIFNGNWVDVLILIFLLLNILEGIRKGFIRGIINLGGFILSFILALKFYPLVGNFLIPNFSLPHGIANAIGFFAIGIGAQSLLSIVGLIITEDFIPLIYKILDIIKIGFFIKAVDKILGIIPAIIESLIIVSFLLTLFVILPIRGSIKKDIQESKLGTPLINQTQMIEKQLNGVFKEAVNETLTFLTINSSPTSEESVNLKFTQTQVSIDQNSEETMLKLVNNERVKIGLEPLITSNNLQLLARNYAKDMFARGYFSHYNPEKLSPFDRMQNGNIQFSTAGENLALTPNVTLAHQGLMNSPGHRANILNPEFKHVGIGVIDGGIYGEMFVQEFTN